ncbi:hypothetical protein GCM10009094_42090 [Massilia aurea]
MAAMLSQEKLKENALTSIRLGVEDFQRASRAATDGGDPERAISAARNLFAGLLLLFKYGLATKVTKAEEIDSLLFNPPRQIVPHPNGTGGVQWRPVGKFAKQTIDVDGIKSRFEAFGIEVNWDAMRQLQDERNNLEHLHPTKSIGAIAGFVAETFPIVQQFVVEELEEVPADFLGPCWRIMLEHRAFFEGRLQECLDAWRASSVPSGMLPYLASIRCGECGSPLLAPSQDDDGEYTCVACGESSPLMSELMEAVTEAEAGSYDPYDGDEPPLRDCPNCSENLFVVADGECRWCGYELEDWECVVCGEALGLDDQHNGGLCGYHAYQRDKDD